MFTDCQLLAANRQQQPVMLRKLINNRGEDRAMAEQNGYRIDQLDARIILDMAEHPRSGILEMSRRLEVARNTVYARLSRMEGAGVITGYGPDIDLSVIGYDVQAFCTVELLQGRFEEVANEVAKIPEVIEIHTIAGQGDLVCKVVSNSNPGIMAIVERILKIPGVDRTTTAISLTEQMRRRTHQLVATVLAE
jgi:DNA-binding Lrp family transcriptional regulator